MSEAHANDVQRVGMVIGPREDREAEYRTLHADDPPGARDLLVRHHLHNLSIIVHRLPDGRLYEFAGVEDIGDDLEVDTAGVAR